MSNKTQQIRERQSHEDELGHLLLTEDAPISFNLPEGTMVECQGCQRTHTDKASHTLFELIQTLAKDGWRIEDNELACPKCSGENPWFGQ